MRIQIIGDNLEITSKIRDLVEEKLGLDLEKYLPDLDQEIKTASVTIKKHTRWVIKSISGCGCLKNIKV